MTNINNTLDELERLHAASTSGEWAVDISTEPESEPDQYFIMHRDELVAEAVHGPSAAAIVALHNAFPALLAYVRALEEAGKGLREHIKLRGLDCDECEEKLSRLDAARAKLNGGK